MYALHIPADMTRHMISTAWNLGQVFFTDGAMELADSENFDINVLLLKHLVGDYGLISSDPIDQFRNEESRAAGRPFTSMFELDEHYVKVVTIPELKRTVVCLSIED